MDHGDDLYLEEYNEEEEYFREHRRRQGAYNLHRIYARFASKALKGAIGSSGIMLPNDVIIKISRKKSLSCVHGVLCAGSVTRSDSVLSADFTGVPAATASSTPSRATRHRANVLGASSLSRVPKRRT